MIRRLRRKLIGVVMLSLTVILIIVVGAINICLLYTSALQIRGSGRDCVYLYLWYRYVPVEIKDRSYMDSFYPDANGASGLSLIHI